MIEHLSFSSINKAYQCPYYWKSTYIDKIKSPSGEAADWGSAYGIVLQSHLTNKEPEEGELKNFNSELLSDVEQAVKKYKEQSHCWTQADSVEKEIRITPEQWEELAERYEANSVIHYPIIGFADAVKENKSVMDIKTSSKAGFKTDWGFQLVFYCLALNIKTWELHQCIRRSNSFDFHFYKWFPDNEMIKFVMNWLANGSKLIKDIIENESTCEAKPGYWCTYCPNKLNCPVFHFQNITKL